MLIGGLEPAKWEQVFKDAGFWDGLPDSDAFDREVLAALASDHVGGRRVAAKLAGRSSMRSALPQLIAVLDDVDVVVVTRALHSLCSHQDPTTLAHQVRMLEHVDPTVRVGAADSIALMLGGHAAPTIVAALQEQLADRDQTVRAAAAWALAEAGPDAAPAADALARLLDERDSQTRRAASRALITSGARPDLVERVLRDRDTRGSALSAYGVDAKDLHPPLEAIPAIVEALGDRDKMVVTNALLALRGLGERAAPAVGAIAKLLTDKREWMPRSALVALADIGAPAAAALPALAKALRAPNLAYNASEVLAAIGPPALPTALAALRERTEPTRIASVRIVARYPDDPRALDAVCALLRDPSPRVRHETVLVLHDIGAAALPAKTALERAADDPDETVREAARVTLEKLG